MNADAEGNVTVALPVELHLVGVFEMVRVVVGTREVHENLVTLLERDPAVLDVLGGVAGHGHRRVEAQQFLYGGVPQLRLGHHAAAIVVMAGEVPQSGADGRPGGVDAGHQLQVAHADDHLVGQQFTLVLGLAQSGDEVVLRILSPVGYLGGEEISNDVPVLGPQLRLLEPQLEHAAHPLDEVVHHGLVDPKLSGNNPRRDLLGVVDCHVALPLVDEPVDEFMTEPLRVGALGGDALRGEVGQ